MQLNKFFAAGAVATFALLGWTLCFSPADSATISESGTSSYLPRTVDKLETTPDGAWEIQKLMRGDIETGEMNESGMNELRDEVIRMAAQQGSSDRSTEHYWNEMGPDNIGGRTRAIVAVIQKMEAKKPCFMQGQFLAAYGKAITAEMIGTKCLVWTTP